MHKANLVQQYMEQQDAPATGMGEEAPSLERTRKLKQLMLLSALSVGDLSGNMISSVGTKKLSEATNSLVSTFIPEIKSTKEFVYLFDLIR